MNRIHQQRQRCKRHSPNADQSTLSATPPRQHNRARGAASREESPRRKASGTKSENKTRTNTAEAGARHRRFTDGMVETATKPFIASAAAAPFYHFLCSYAPFPSSLPSPSPPQALQLLLDEVCFS
ncbi:hypothetical protein BHE74_00025239 [Ensete ventricosum]|nr:hypothetical protein GW17_00029565 [Ensete ventricosum]RWW67324.1 hypothetical protein BHE74_00025239 [Ensete ventricosum]RZS15140.1 hypothetical protein BHM03_00046975 [Ensete ventricosum]